MLEGKKFWIMMGVFVLILCSPFIYISEPTMSCQQKQIEKNPSSTSSKESQLRIAGIYYNTLRPEKARDAYKLYWTRYPKDPQRPFALDRYARCLHELGMAVEEVKAWKKLGREYPNHELGKDATEHLRVTFNLWSLED